MPHRVQAQSLPPGHDDGNMYVAPTYSRMALVMTLSVKGLPKGKSNFGIPELNMPDIARPLEQLIPHCMDKMGGKHEYSLNNIQA